MKTSKASSRLALIRKRNAARRRAAHRKTPLGRLSLDGAYSAQKARLRLQWLAHELRLPADNLPNVSGRDYLSDELSDFVQQHHVSLDWLLCGDLKGLQRMVLWRKAFALPFWRSHAHEAQQPSSA